MQILEDKSIVAATVGGGIKIIKDGIGKDYKIQNLAGQKAGSFRSFEKDGVMIFAFLSDEAKKLIVYDFVNKTQIATYVSEYPILYLEVDFSGELILFFTADNKLNTFDVGAKRVLSSIFVAKEFVATKIVFNYDLSKVALINETGQGFICAPASLRLTGSFMAAGHNACFNGFLDEKNFVSISKDGTVSIVDTDTMKVSKYSMRFQSFCKKGFFVDENRYFLGIFRDSSFAIFDVENEKIISTGKLATPHEPSMARFDEKNMLLVVEDVKNIISLYDIATLFADFKSLFSRRDFVACYKLIAENELLGLSDAVTMLEDVFSAFAASALKMAEAENYDGAIKQLSAFMNVPQKRNELKEIVESIEAMRSFVGFIRAKKFANAYNLSDRYRFLRLTAYYKSMEDGWQSVVEQAKTLMVAGRLEEAKECFTDFRGVGSKTELIKKILSERETVNLFLKKIAGRDFKAAFELANLHPFLKEIKEFKTIKELGEKGTQKALLLLKTGEIQKAFDAINALKAISIFKSEVEQLEKKAFIYQKYHAYQKANDRIKIKILEKKYPFLTEADSCPL